MKILLLEDDRILSDTISDFIEEAGHECDVAYTGNSALDKIYEESYQLYLLDINVPGISGLELLQELREAEDKTPIVLITSLSNESDVLKGYESGCDDYIRKPFSLSELLYKINIIFKRVYGVNESVVKLSDNIVFDLSTNEIKKDDEIIHLKKKEGQLLSLFITHRGVVLTKDDIVASIWHDSIPSDAVVRVYLSSIKKILGNDLLVTIRGLGYRLEKL